MAAAARAAVEMVAAAAAAATAVVVRGGGRAAVMVGAAVGWGAAGAASVCFGPPTPSYIRSNRCTGSQCNPCKPHVGRRRSTHHPLAAVAAQVRLAAATSCHRACRRHAQSWAGNSTKALPGQGSPRMSWRRCVGMKDRQSLLSAVSEGTQATRSRGLSEWRAFMHRCSSVVDERPGTDRVGVAELS